MYFINITDNTTNKSWKEEFDSYVRSGFAVSDDEHIALTLDGIDISNRIMSLFV